MSSTTIQAEASKPQRKMQECNRCKAAGFPGQMISFEKMGIDPASGRTKWKLIGEDGSDHAHKAQALNPDNHSTGPVYFKKRRVVDLATVTDIAEAKKLLSSGWEYKTSYPATIANVPHYVLVKRE